MNPEGTGAGEGPVRVHMLKNDVEMEEQNRAGHVEQEQQHLVHNPQQTGVGYPQQRVAPRRTERCANCKQDTLYAIALAVCIFLVVVLGAAILGPLAHQQGWFGSSSNSTNSTNGNGTAAIPNQCNNCSSWASNVNMQPLMASCTANATSPACCSILSQTFSNQPCTQFYLSQQPSTVQQMVPSVLSACNLNIPAACPGTSFNIPAAGTNLPTSSITTPAPGASTAAPGASTAAPGDTTAPPGTFTAVPSGSATPAPGQTTQTPSGAFTNVPGSTTTAPDATQPGDETTAAPGTTTTAATTTTTAPP